MKFDLKPLHTTYRFARRIVILIVGITVLLLGLIMVVTPGPALVVIPTGLAILGIEFAWARRWLRQLREAGNSALGRKKPPAAENASARAKPSLDENASARAKPSAAENNSARAKPPAAENVSARAKPPAAENNSGREQPPPAEKES